MANNNDKKVLNVPVLRFPEFTEEWKRIRVSDLLDFYSTNSLSWEQLEYESNEPYNLHYGLIHVGLPTLVDLTKDKLPSIKEENVPKKYELCKEGDVAFADASEDTNEVAKVVEFYHLDGKKVVCGLHTIHGRDNNKQTAKGFLGYCFSSTVFHNQIRRIAQGTKIYSINTRNFSEVFVGLPSKSEQHKIATLLRLIDEHISTQNKIIEDLKKLKSAIAETLFCTPKESMPAKRVSPYNKEWKLIKLSDICQRVQTKNTGNQCRQVLTIAAQHGLVNQEDFFNKTVASENLEGYYLLQKGDFAYNKSYSGGYTWGAIKRLEWYDKGVLSPLYICFRPDSSKVNADFLAHYFESKKWHKGIADIAGEGARNHGLLNISVIDFFNTIHRIPDLDEQKDIARILNSLSSKLSCEQRVIQNLTMQRSYLLHKMFI